MDRLDRTSLLLFEYSRPGAQRKRPGGVVKDLSHRLRQKTSATMPSKDAPLAKFGRRVLSRVRGTEARDRHPGLSSRRADRAHRESRPMATSHLHKRRDNPQASSNRLRRRGNPQAPNKTEVRESPSKLERRPTLPKTPKFFSRGDLMKGRRL